MTAQTSSQPPDPGSVLAKPPLCEGARSENPLFISITALIQFNLCLNTMHIFTLGNDLLQRRHLLAQGAQHICFSDDTRAQNVKCLKSRCSYKESKTYLTWNKLSTAASTKGRATVPLNRHMKTPERSGSVLLNQVSFNPQGTLANLPRKIFGFHNRGMGTRDASKHPTMHRMGLTTKNFLAPNVNSAKIKKSWSKFQACSIYTADLWDGKNGRLRTEQITLQALLLQSPVTCEPGHL